MLNRRQFMVTTGVAVAMAAFAPDFTLQALAQQDVVDPAELMKPGPLPEMALGDPNAKVTIVEYLSMTCPHCAHFHETTYKELKTKYIDTGKVRFVMREFPLDPLAAAGFMLARNAMGDKYFDVVDLLLEKQKEWAYAEDPASALRALAKQFGYTDATFEATLSDQKLLDDINAIRARGADTFGVNSTPTFFINGRREKGSMSIDDLAKIVDPLLQG
ncbi:thioredoxin domain-containing protein [Chthonobacter albigriseus]|uniref:thioredoxin domain-containing protein n=1 Tax=Chthonobacter albigriseus TaxID=1683161 RepID=UPI0015EF57CF|nr:thioredoxin domain-containing protein [Chthonobacter albigriseus]